MEPSDAPKFPLVLGPTLHPNALETDQLTSSNRSDIVSIVDLLVQVFFECLYDLIGPTCTVELSIKDLNSTHIVIDVNIPNISRGEHSRKNNIECLVHEFSPSVKTVFPGSTHSSFQLEFRHKKSLSSVAISQFLTMLTQQCESLLRTLHCSAPVGYSLDSFRLAASGPEFSSFESLLSFMTTNKMAKASTDERDCSTRLAILLDDPKFPHRTINFIHYQNFKFDYEQKEIDDTVLASLFKTQHLANLRLVLHNTQNKDTPADIALPTQLVPSIQIKFSYLHRGTTKKGSKKDLKTTKPTSADEISNLVLILDSTPKRAAPPQKPIDQLLKCVIEASAGLATQFPTLFTPRALPNSPPPPVTSEPATSTLQHPKPLSTPKKLLPQTKAPTKGSVKATKTTKASLDENKTLQKSPVPPCASIGQLIKKEKPTQEQGNKQRNAPSISKKSSAKNSTSTKPTKATTPTATAPPKSTPKKASPAKSMNHPKPATQDPSPSKPTITVAKSEETKVVTTAKVVAPVKATATTKVVAAVKVVPPEKVTAAVQTTTAQVAAPAVSTQAQVATPMKVDKKRKRGQELEDTNDYSFFLESIADSITSIVQGSQNSDFVSACYLSLGIDSAGQLKLEREDIMASFRSILESDLKNAVQNMSKSNSRKQRFLGKETIGTHGPDPALEDLVADGDYDDWLDDLSPEEISELWQPQTVLPRDAKWTDVLWTPCNAGQFEEERFERVWM